MEASTKAVDGGGDGAEDDIDESGSFSAAPRIGFLNCQNFNMLSAAK
jgi:hypothetical protein